MTFTITYRAKDGALREERIEAASRAECVAECKRRGIAPIRIAEGGGRAGSTKPPRGDGRTKPGMWRVAVLAAVLAAVAGGAWWWYGHAGRVTVPVEKPKIEKPKAERPVKAWTEPSPPAVTNEVARPVEVRPPAPAWRDPKATDEQRTEAYAKMLAESPLPNTSSNRLFRSGLEQVMGWVFTTEVGDMPPPLPRVPDFDIVHLKEILESKCEVKADDTAKQADAKNTVEFAKEELKKYLEKGGSPDEFLQYYHDQLKTAYLHRKMVMDQVMMTMRDDPDLAEDFLKEANKGLAEKGIKEVVIPERLRRSVENSRKK